MFRYTDYLPYNKFPTIVEGGTPLLEDKNLAERLGLNNVYLKNEFQNPTGTHKDRMNPFIVQRAIENNKEIVVAASSGNEGVSLAAYAARAGIKCIIVTTDNILPNCKEAILATGAEIIFTKTAFERWEIIKKHVEEVNWFSATNYMNPPVGSSYFGVQGYKTISYEIYEYFGDNIPNYLAIPTSRGDLLFGIFEGFKELNSLNIISKIPKLIAVEPIPRLELILSSKAETNNLFEGKYSLTPSVGGNTVTRQSVVALNRSKGYAVSVSQEEAILNTKELSKSGIFLEGSSAIVYGGIKKLVKEGKIPKNEEVVLIMTSYGSRNSYGMIKEILR
ncbi:pyridoxal-phosphate dependent enzyme [Miniphocaeibacter massiliensis]|uniref:pyridoxal-phosphate dependent enzyme n=1 Tax=Miniphocaeibacter massiliensis TaxID=2041841 RepID=UPI000C1BA732|nr:pyridoxal-phosphate dependent enzyme [Miniphocaeibacter massiliensis]